MLIGVHDVHTSSVMESHAVQCILRWSVSQLEANSTLTALACPLCKLPYHSAFTDLSSNYFRYTWGWLFHGLQMQT